MAALAPRDVEDEKQNPAASDVAKKIVTETDVAVRSFDQTRDVGDRRPAIAIEIDYTDYRMKGGEWIGRDFRVRRGEFAEQSRFAGIGITHQRSISHRSKLEEEMSLLALSAFGVLNRRAIPRALEMNIAFPAASTLAKNELLAVVREIGDFIRRIVLLWGRRTAWRE